MHSVNNHLVLVVDDERPILQLVRLYLEQDGYRVEDREDGDAGLKAFFQLRPGLIVLDVMLPKIDGFEVCRRIRESDVETPILMLTAKDEDLDKIMGLELGADDYLTKPFNPRELVARVAAILRRTARAGQADAQPILAGPLRIDPVRRLVLLRSKRLELRAQEFELLATFARQPGRVFTREQLLQQAWGIDYFGQTRTVDVHVAQLRRKLEGDGAMIETVTGVGYRLVHDVSRPPRTQQ
jgi:DNA-binding response OmpR family regulator